MNAPAKPETRRLFRLAAFLVLSAACLAAPGGHLVEAISDECETINPIWSAGLRGMPESLNIQNGALSIRSLDNGDDPYPSAEDMISTYAHQLGRSLDASEGPSIITCIWLPSFNEWPTGVNASGFREWFGVRVTAYDADLPLGNGFYFPGIYISTDDAGPCLIARVGDGYGPDITIARIATSGWWTLGLSWNAEGVTEYYGAPGRVSLTNADLLHVSPSYEDAAANRSIDELIGNFIALRMTYPPTGQLSTNWQMDKFRVYLRTPPALPQPKPRLEDGQIHVLISGSARGFRYLLQRSNDLVSWSTVVDHLSDGHDWSFSEEASERGFYRVARP